MARQIYSTVLQHNPSNMMAAKRQYTMIKSQPNQELQSIESLNDYITTHLSYNDSSIFYELYRQYQNIGQYVYGIYCLQQVLYIMSAIRNADTVHLSLLHCELAECYLTSCCDGGGDTTDTTIATTAMETIRIARKHMTIALELHPLSLRAQFGLVVIANRYLLYSDDSTGGSTEQALVDDATSGTSSTNNNKTKNSNSKNNTTNKSLAYDDRFFTLTHEINVSKELIRYSTEQIVETTTNKSTGSSLCTKSMQLSIQALIDEYTEGL